MGHTKKAVRKKDNTVSIKKTNRAAKTVKIRKAAKTIKIRPLKKKNSQGRITLRKLKVKTSGKTVKTKEKPKKKIIKRKHLTVLSKTRKITPEQKYELEKLHGILSDSFVRQMLIEIGGENALIIVRNFYGSHSDEELSKSLELRISDVRATLNRLHNEGLVKYIREKDSETGWYSYSWTLNKDRIVEWVSQYTQKCMGPNGKEGNDYYFCPTCGLGSIVEFAIAHDADFRCNKCNKSLEFLEEEHFSSLNQHLRKN